MSDVKHCAHCGTAYSRRPRRAFEHFQKSRFCSLACADHGRPSRPIRSPSTRYKTIVTPDGRRMGEHRYVMEQAVGRRLRSDEFVHHRNGDRLDNRLSNLEIMSPLQHGREHNLRHALTTMCAVCGRVFVPHKTKRGRKRTCSATCAHQQISRSQRVLTDTQIRDLRTARIARVPLAALARRYGVSQTTISKWWRAS